MTAAKTAFLLFLFGCFASGLCQSVRCPALPKIQNVYFLPSDCGLSGGTQGKTCFQYCNDGYDKIKGDTARHCQKDGTWSGLPITCKKYWPAPWISCPPNIYADLPTGKNTASVGSKWELPQSNYKTITVSSPVGADSQYQFPAGQTKVEWTVTNPEGKTDKCIQLVTLDDKEPPKVVSCPGPTIFVTAYTKGPYHVTYKEPEFSDNVGIAKVDKIFVKKTYKSIGSYNQVFMAYDKAGNRAICKFVVTIGGTKCTTYPDDRGLPGLWQYLFHASTMAQTAVRRICPTRTIPSSADYFFTYRCDKAKGKWNPERALDCVEFKWANETVQCAVGYEKKQIYKTFYNCVKCSLGTYFKDGKCTMCPAGTSQDKQGQTMCNKCPSGTSSLQGDFVCRDLCPAGTFSKDGMRPFCTLCPQGQYQDQQGQTSCNVCAQSKFTNTKLGATSCQDMKPSGQQQNGLLEISLIKKPKKWTLNASDKLECLIKDNNFKLVSVKWKIINKYNIPDDFLSKPKFEEIRDNAGKLVGSRLVISGSPENARVDYVCVAANVNGEIRKTVNVPWPY